MSTPQAPVSPNARWLVPLVVAALAVVALWGFHNLPSDSIPATIIESTASEPVDGQVDVTISFSFPSNPETIERRQVTISEDQLDTGVIPIWVVSGDTFSLKEPGMFLTPFDFVLAAVIGGLLGVVMVFTMQGYGYVRGDGEPGSRPEVPVGEEQGFYWRT